MIGITSVESAIKIFTKVMAALEKIVAKQEIIEAKLIDEIDTIETKVYKSREEVAKARKVIANIQAIVG